MKIKPISKLVLGAFMFFALTLGAMAELKKTDGEIISASVFSSFAECVASPLNAGKTVIVSSPMTLTTDCTVSDNRTVWVEKSGVITVALGKTLTINGPFHAGLYQVFSEGSAVIFGNGSVKEVFPQWWGAKGDGKTDDTLSFQSAVNSIAKNPNGKIYVPDSSDAYMIKATGMSKFGMDDGGIIITQPIDFEMHPNAKLKAIAGNKNGSCILNIRNANNVFIRGGKIIGDRGSHIGTQGEHGMGIIIDSSQFVTVKDIVVSDCWGDGIGLRYSKAPNAHIAITNVKSINNRRQGLTIGSSTNVIVSHCEFSNTNGTAPEAGIDIEPNPSDPKATDILINGCIFDMNKSFGIVLGGGAGCKNIVISNNIFKNTGEYGISISSQEYRAENVSMTGNIITAGIPTTIAIFLSGALNTTIENNSINIGGVASQSGTGIYLYRGNKAAKISSNMITGAKEGIMLGKADSTNITINSNTLRLVDRGIMVKSEFNGGYISDNTFENISGVACQGKLIGATILNNKFVDVGREAFNINIVNTVLKGNVFWNIGTVDPVHIPIIDVKAEKSVLEGNIFYSAATTQIAIKSTELPMMPSIFTNNIARYGTSAVLKINAANLVSNNYTLP